MPFDIFVWSQNISLHLWLLEKLESLVTMQTSLSLKELLLEVRNAITQCFPSSYWVTADISDFHENANGHCYMELVQKNDSSKLIEAKVRAIIYANNYQRLKNFFMLQTGQQLRTGMKILVEVSVSYHELYGMSCVIHDIDPTFTLGDMARKRMETIARLKTDGVWDMNREVEMPPLIKRIAVISSASAAGFGDFCNQLQNNGHVFNFKIQLFPAIMQGDQSANSVIAALDQINEVKNDFDVVAIIRGGGATTDLLAFDEYELSFCVANFPLPIITGIGHERDESVTDMVAHTRCKTPTAVAAFIYEKMMAQEERLISVEERFYTLLIEKLANEHKRLDDCSQRIVRACSNRFVLENQKLSMYQQRLALMFHNTIQEQRHKIEMYENTLKHISPENILKRGYSITVVNGKVLKNAGDATSGDELRTILSNGELRSVVK